MRGRALSLVAAAAIVAAVALSLRSESRFAVEAARLEREAGGARVAGTLVNAGARAARVLVEVTVVGVDGRVGEKETLELRDVEAGARVPFTGRLHPGDVRTYRIQVSEGRNPYGN